VASGLLHECPMTRERFRIGFIGALVLSQVVSLSATENRWTGAGGNWMWTNAANWSLGIPPQVGHAVVIAETGTNVVVLNAPAQITSLELGGSVGAANLSITSGICSCEDGVLIRSNACLKLTAELDVAGSAQIDGTVYWTSGTWKTWGTCFITTNGSLTIGPGQSNVLYGTLINSGTIACSGPNLFADTGCQILNSNRLILNTNLALLPASYGSPPPQFDNHGLILVGPGSGTTALLIGVNFINFGTLQADTNSILEVHTIDSGWATFQNGSLFSGSGLVRFTTGNGNIGWDGLLTVNGTVELDGVMAWGAPVWTGPGLLRWKSGGMHSFTFAPGFQVQMSGADDKFMEGDCLNEGTLRWLDDSMLTTWSGATFINSGRFQVENGGTWNNSIVFSNQAGGTFRQTAGQFTLGTLVNVGSVVELERGVLHLSTAFASDGSSSYRLALGGYWPGTDFGRLNTAMLAPGGALVITLTNGFAPTNGAVITLATDTARLGEFATTLLPALGSNQTWRVRYAADSIALEVAAPTRLGGVTRLPDGTFQFTLTGAAAAGYLVQVSTNLTHWSTIESNSPFNGTLIFTDTNAPGFGRRFYRTQIIE
jgi:hypothetical protein